MRSGGASNRLGRGLLVAAPLALGLAALALQMPALAGDAPGAPGSAEALVGSGSDNVPASTTVIPPMAPVTEPEAAGTGAAGNAASRPAPAEVDIDQYRDAQDVDSAHAPRLHSLNEFLAETSDLSPIGVEIRQDHCKLADGERAEGLAIVGVRRGSPAAQAGLRAAANTTHSVLEGFMVVASLVFPPAILATALLDSSHVGESYDLIVGVDGERVSNVLEFEDRMRDVKPGDIVYLSLIRDGSRIQVPVHVPLDTAWTY